MEQLSQRERAHLMEEYGWTFYATISNKKKVIVLWSRSENVKREVEWSQNEWKNSKLMLEKLFIIP